MFEDMEKPAGATIEAPNSKLTVLSIAIVGLAAYYDGQNGDKLSGKMGGLLLVDKVEQKEAIDMLKEQMKIAAQIKFGSPSLAGLRLGVRQGDEKKADGSPAFKHASFAGKLVVTARSAKPIVTFFGPNRTPCEASEVEGGDLCVFEVRPFGYVQGANKGISLGLNAVWKLEAGKVKITRGGSAGSSFGSVNLGSFKFGGAAPAAPSAQADDGDGEF